MRLALFARLPRTPSHAADGRLLDRLVKRRYDGIDLRVGADDEALAATVVQLHSRRLRMVARISTASAASDAPDAHVAALASSLDVVASTVGEVAAHVVVQVQPSKPWSRDEALAYLDGALPLSATFLERHPHLGASSRESDTFGGRPVHLHGVSHACTSSDWGVGPLPAGEACDVYPILRLSLDPRDARREHEARRAPFREHEHVDHLTLRPSAAALEMLPRYWRAVRAVMDLKARRGAELMPVSVPMQVAVQDPRAGGLDDARLFESLIRRIRTGVGSGKPRR